MRLFDSHFHFSGTLTPAEYRAFITAEALNAGVPAEKLELNAVGGDLAESRRAREFAALDADSVFSAGVHPHRAGEFTGTAATVFAEFRGAEKLVAVGELGLDYFYENAAPERQHAVLEDFLALALDWNLPAIIHLRDRGDERAYADGFERLRDFAGAGGRFVIHCFTGTFAYLEKFLALGGYIGVTGMVAFRRAENIRALAARIPAERLLLETDSPYLAPPPYRGRENHPGWLGLVAAALAEARGVTPEELGELTAGNARSFFHWREHE